MVRQQFVWMWKQWTHPNLAIRNSGGRTKNKIMNESRNSSKNTNSHSFAKFQIRKMKYLKIKWNNFVTRQRVEVFLFKKLLLIMSS